MTPWRINKLLAASLLLVGYATAGCGRPATVEDCEEIVEHVTAAVVNTKLPDADKETIAEEIAKQKALHKEIMMDKCVGKRITNDIMQCVRQRHTADDIIDECF